MKNDTLGTENETPEISPDALGKSETVKKLENALQEMKNKDAGWKAEAGRIYEAKLKLTDPIFVQINQVRQALRYYLIPLLQRVIKMSEEKQEQFFKCYPFIFSKEGMDRFFCHFYGVNTADNTERLFEKRDPFEQDMLNLYDLYKAKRTIKGIKEFIKLLENQKHIFPSIYNKSQQMEILQGVNSALFVVFKQVLKPEFQVEIFRNINLDYISSEKIEERRKQGLVYSQPEKLEGNPGRRIFLFILFQNHIKTVINKKTVNIYYNLADFEHLIGEFFDCFLDNSNYQDEVLKIYHNLYIQSKTLTENLIDDPDPENLIYEAIDEIKTFI